jgi:outer membrane protein assembly factor BamB
VAVPGTGWSSPVISRGRVFLTTDAPGAGGGHSLRTLCFDALTGQLLWNTEVFGDADVREQMIHSKNSEASPTPIVEGSRIYVHFGHHGTACLDLTGAVVWRNNRLGYYETVHGNGGSPVIVEDRLIFNADGAEAAYVVALDKGSGELLWKRKRGLDAPQSFSFSTPLLITVNGQRQVISPGSGAVFALDPVDGREIWRVRYGRGYSVVPRPVFGEGLLFVTTGFDRADLLAIRPDGKGDVTETHVAWRTTRGAPLTPSVLLIGGDVFAVNDAGIASCWDARTGQLFWQQRIDGNYSASPITAHGRIYFQNETGLCTVIVAGREFVKLAANDLGEYTLASPAVAENAIFIRTEEHLYRIAGEAAAGGGP